MECDGSEGAYRQLSQEMDRRIVAHLKADAGIKWLELDRIEWGTA